MTDDRDPILEALFAEAREELPGEEFTARVMARSRFARARMVAGWIGAAAILVVCAGLLFMPLQDLALLVARGLTTALVDLGESFWAVVLAPINSVATVLVVTARVARMSMKRIRRASYA